MKNRLPLLLASWWLVVVSLGLSALLVYQNTPGIDGAVPNRWPAQSKIPRGPGLPTLIMFAHPHCPCTRASIGELAALITHCQDRVNAHVVFFRPGGSAQDWPLTDLWRSAATIPGVSVLSDKDGFEARCFGATTSGHVVLYDIDGKLVFSGGITSSRGHCGDNAGRSAITQLLHHEAAAARRTPVFGCSLASPTQECYAKDPPCQHKPHG